MPKPQSIEPLQPLRDVVPTGSRRGLPGAFGALDRAVRKGFWCVPALLKDAFLEPVRALPDFPGLISEAEARAGRAAKVFADAGGERLLPSS